MLDTVTLDLDLVDRGRSTLGGLGSRRSSVAAAAMCLDSFRLFGCSRTLQKMTQSPDSASSANVVLMDSVIMGFSTPSNKYGVLRVTYTSSSTMLESSFHRPTNNASHEIIGNFMTKMTELLEVILANRRGERTQNTSNDEALERFVPF
ncbi:hypothetical protein M9H77_08596 [Catharanthus roseus]|uniref:Uncharacterized protein n=1 Tax=Catharanthus roseus TaxID=4058 RepID=A0ACC0BYE6_CATRO|nr:hypothetical protein M9H77_08596 [Catharanthus roseus]